MKIGIYTLGCKVNMYESEYVINLFEKKGHIIGDFNDINDVYIINTCTVTNTSDVKSRKIINQAIRRNPNACIVAMGCFIEANKDYNEDGIDIYIGNKDKSKIVELVEDFFLHKKKIRDIYDDLGTDFEDMEIDNFKGRTRAFVKIQDGCENFCSYCIIPYVRGKCRSKKFDVVLSEVNSLVNNGYKEVVLTGIHTGNYGVDIGSSFSKLLKELVKIDGLKRLRISSIEITELNDEVLEVIKENNIIVDHLHIPLQAGSDTILKLMNRKYDTAYFKDKIEKIRGIRKDISITTDVIVGFPGESEKLFLETVNFIKEIRFSKLHVFPYSVRSNTKAALMDNKVDSIIKKERARTLILLSHELEKEYMNKFIGKNEEVLIETYKDGYSYGHTSNYLGIKIFGEYSSGSLINVLIEKEEYPYLLARVSTDD